MGQDNRLSVHPLTPRKKKKLATASARAYSREVKVGEGGNYLFDFQIDKEARVSRDHGIHHPGGSFFIIDIVLESWE